MSQKQTTSSTGHPLVARAQPHVALVAAMTTEYIIGIANTLPWILSADLKRFRNLTTDHCLVMGRKTYESIGHPLRDRRNVIVSRGGFSPPLGCEVASTLDEAFACCRTGETIFVIGGGELYRQAIPRADRIYLTLIDLHEKKLPLFNPFEGDAYFPSIDPAEWAIERLGRRNVARPRGKPAPIPLRSVYFRFIDMVRIKDGLGQVGRQALSNEKFQIEAYERAKKQKRFADLARGKSTSADVGPTGNG